MTGQVEAVELLAHCYEDQKEDFVELRQRFEHVHGETMRPPMYETIEKQKRTQLKKSLGSPQKEQLGKI